MCINCVVISKNITMHRTKKMFDNIRKMKRKLSAKLRKRKFFTGVNISLFSKHSKNLKLRTNEAGAGETLSCGSASAATASFNINNRQESIEFSRNGPKQFNTPYRTEEDLVKEAKKTGIPTAAQFPRI